MFGGEDRSLSYAASCFSGISILLLLVVVVRYVAEK